MDFPRCNTCHWWKQEPETRWETTRTGVRQCFAARFLDEALSWSDDSHENQISPDYADVSQFPMDGSGYHATLYTRPEHGCTMHSTMLPKLAALPYELRDRLDLRKEPAE